MLHHIGYLSEESCLELLAGLVYERYVSDDAVGRPSMTNRQLKHEHKGLIYAGGLPVAVAEGLQYRSETGNEKGVDDLMRFMFDKHSTNAYDLTEIERGLGDLNNSSQNDFFERYIHGPEQLPVSTFLALAGVDTVDEDSRSICKVRVDADSREIRRRLFGD